MLMASSIVNAGDAERAVDGRVASPDEMRVVSPDGQYIAPRVGETIPGGAVRDGSGRCQFDVQSNGPQLELNGDTCQVKVLTKGKRSKSLLRNPQLGERKPHAILEDQQPWKAPDQSELSGAPTDPNQLKGTSQNVDPAMVPTPEPQSKSGEDARVTSYNVSCPREKVKLYGKMHVVRYEGVDSFHQPIWHQIAAIYPHFKFYHSLLNGGIGSVEPYRFPSDWASWVISYQTETHFIFRGFRGVGPLSFGPSEVRSYAVGYFASNVGAHETLEITGTLYAYRDMYVYNECSAHGALRGVNRLKCQGHGRRYRPAEC